MSNSREMAATVIGSVIGAVAVYLFFTDRGRNGLRQIERALEDFSRELMSLRNAVQRAAGAVSDTWEVLSETFGQSGEPPGRYPSRRTLRF
jgi:uncharacterized membrane protein YccC